MLALANPVARQRARFMTLGWGSWAAVLSALLAILVILYIVLPRNPIDGWLTKQFVAPELERELGFNASLTESGLIQITNVVPGGIFEKAGVKSGYYQVNTFTCANAHPYSVFYYRLKCAKGKSVTMQFITSLPYAESKLVAATIEVPK